MKNWFEGKSISLIGNAQSLTTFKHGQLIDSSDVVCRINRGIISSNTYPISHGTKTDVLFINLMETARVFVKTPWYKVISISPGTNGYNLVDYFYPREYLDELMKSVPKPSTGLRALDYISKCNPLEIKVFGFDWKETPTIAGAKVMRVIGDHNFKLEKQYCFDTFFNKNNIKYI
jgi:hypothetical protein